MTHSQMSFLTWFDVEKTSGLMVFVGAKVTLGFQGHDSTYGNGCI